MRDTKGSFVLKQAHIWLVGNTHCHTREPLQMTVLPRGLWQKVSADLRDLSSQIKTCREYSGLNMQGILS